ncbi:MAG: DJ-1/PfpI family protein [Eubacterium sp.]|nr:DJ-1/PfpI family protein [Eubacterium sp.]
MVYVFFAEGFEEVEALTAVDLIRRSGEKLQTVSVMGEKRVTGSHGITIETDILFDEVSLPADMLVLPGGMPGTKNLGAHEGLCKLLRQQYEEEGWLAAICAAPSVFAGLGFLKDRKATSYPGAVTDRDCGAYLEEEVVADGNIVTSRGVGTAIPFALKLVEILKGKEMADKISGSIIYRR